MAALFNDMDGVSDALAFLKKKKQNGNPVVRRIRKSFFDPKRFQNSISVEFRNNKKDLGTAAWDVLAAFMMYLKANHITKNLVAYGECICELVKASSPKEVYIGVLEQYDPSTDFRYIEMLHPAMQLILTKYVETEPNSCAVSFETALSTMLCYFDSFNKPEFSHYDPEQPLEKDYENLKCLKYMERSLDLISPAVTNLLLRKDKIKKVDRFKAFCFQFTCHMTMMCIRLDTDASKPSIQYDSNDKDDKQLSEIEYTPCLPVVHSLIGLKLQLFSLKYLFDRADWVTMHPPDSFVSPAAMAGVSRQIFHGKASLLYYVFCRGIRLQEFPKIYSSTGLLCRSISEVIALLTWHAPVVLWKALQLLSYVVERTEKSSICCDEVLYNLYLDFHNNPFVQKPKSAVRKLLENLAAVAVNWNITAIRQKSCKLLTEVIDMFHWRDKLMLLTFILKTYRDCGVVGYIIRFLKDKLDTVLRDDAPPGSEVFCNQRRMKMLGSFIFHLPNGSDTDLLENCDKIMASLNLLRFLLIRDKANRTGIFDNLGLIQTNYVQAIRFDIEVSRQHYSNESLIYYEKMKKKSKETTDMTVNGHVLDDLTCEDRVKTLQAAIHTFSMMEVVAIRVEELIDELTKDAKFKNEPVAQDRTVPE